MKQAIVSFLVPCKYILSIWIIFWRLIYSNTSTYVTLSCVILDDMHFWIELHCVILSLFYYWFFRTTFIFGTFQLRKYSNFWSISFQKVCPLSLTSVVDWQKSTVHFWAVLHFYSIANFVASWLIWLQMILNDSKWLHLIH